MRNLIRIAPLVLLAVLALGVVASYADHDERLAAVSTGGACGHLVADLNAPSGLGTPPFHAPLLPVTGQVGAPTLGVSGIFHPPRTPL